MPGVTRARRWRTSTPRRSVAARARGCSAPTPICPRDISLRWVQPVPDHFHARYSALARSYRYLILNRTAALGAGAGRALLVHQRLDLGSRCRRRPQSLLGEHDFSAFRSSECQAHSPVRRTASAVDRAATGDWVTIERHRQRLPASHGAQHRRAAAGDRSAARAGRASARSSSSRARAAPGNGHRAGLRTVPLAGRLPAAVRAAGRFGYDRAASDRLAVDRLRT